MRRTMGWFPRAVFVCTALASVSACSSGGGGGGGGGGPATCPATVIASWKANGTSFQSSTSLFIATPPTFGLTVVACQNDGADRTLGFTLLPYPPAAGTYPLKFKMLHGQPANGFAGAEYIVTKDTNYFTAPTGPDSTGSVVITSVDTAGKKFSGTFSFHATDDSGTKSIDIAEGVLTNVKYE